MGASTVRPIHVSPELHKQLRVLAGYEDKQLKEVADDLLPVVEQRIETARRKKNGMKK